jgi:acyl-CoA synthetase (AMP-forming)/AMP-acid ligase II
VDNDLYVLGRQDDVIIVGGKNVYPEDVEALAGEHPDVHDGRVVALGVFNPELGTDDLVIVAEMSSEDCAARGRAIEADVRQRVLSDLGVAPRLVVLVPPRWVVKSTAGKPARGATRAKLLGLHPELAARPT